jgi:hypothetical protein
MTVSTWSLLASSLAYDPNRDSHCREWGLVIARDKCHCEEWSNLVHRLRLLHGNIGNDKGVIFVYDSREIFL